MIMMSNNGNSTSIIKKFFFRQTFNRDPQSTFIFWNKYGLDWIDFLELITM